MKKCLIALVCWIVAGAATASEPLTDDQYEHTARAMYITEKCTSAGQMSPETAAYGRVYLEKNLAEHPHDRPRLEARVQELRQGFEISPAVCNDTSRKILELKLALEQQHKPAAPTTASPTQQPYRPQFTTCNRAFGQLYCTSY